MLACFRSHNTCCSTQGLHEEQASAPKCDAPCRVYTPRYITLKSPNNKPHCLNMEPLPKIKQHNPYFHNTHGHLHCVGKQQGTCTKCPDYSHHSMGRVQHNRIPIHVCCYQLTWQGSKPCAVCLACWLHQPPSSSKRRWQVARAADKTALWISLRIFPPTWPALGGNKFQRELGSRAKQTLCSPSVCIAPSQISLPDLHAWMWATVGALCRLKNTARYPAKTITCIYGLTKNWICSSIPGRWSDKVIRRCLKSPLGKPVLCSTGLVLALTTNVFDVIWNTGSVHQFNESFCKRLTDSWCNNIFHDKFFCLLVAWLQFILQLAYLQAACGYPEQEQKSFQYELLDLDE